MYDIKDKVCIVTGSGRGIGRSIAIKLAEGGGKVVVNVRKHVDEDKIIAAFSGIRVLLGTGNDPGKISRDFKISVIDNFISVLGGKITDYRVGARKTAKIVSGILNKPLKIKNMPYIDYSRKSQSYILTDKGVNHKNYIDYSKKSQSLEEIIKYECPVKPEDIIRRRLALSIYSLDLGKSLEEKIYTLMEVSHEDPHTGK